MVMATKTTSAEQIAAICFNHPNLAAVFSLHQGGLTTRMMVSMAHG